MNHHPRNLIRQATRTAYWGAVLAGSTFALSSPVLATYPVQRPARATPAAPEGNYTVHPDQLKQVVKGIGFEIQSDSINSGNRGMTDSTSSALHDLVPSERQRLYSEMLKGFRFCRLAGGLYWRGLDPDQKHLEGRWPEQLPEIREMIQKSGVEGVSFEYWSPAPYWKANHQFAQGKGGNILKCFGSKFGDDPDYHGDKDAFLKDFAAACRQDLQTLRDAGIPISIWGLQNEPFASTGYSSCTYSHDAYLQTFKAVAPVIRAFDPKIWIIGDTGNLSWIRPIVNDPATANLVDALVVHNVGEDAKWTVPFKEADGGKPHFQNEYEYLEGPASPARCLNTVESIMNWFQLAGAPTWFWIHALKPIGNSEASGYSLGFWRPPDDTDPADDAKFPGLLPGHWTWNKYNWNAVGSFVRHMPWDCQVVQMDEDVHDPDLRVLAFKRPNGKLTVALSNRSFGGHVFHIDTGLTGATFKGYRYTPDDAGENCMGTDRGMLTGGTISPNVDDMSWEFWEQE